MKTFRRFDCHLLFNNLKIIVFFLVFSCASISDEFTISKIEKDSNSLTHSSLENPKAVDELIRAGNDDYYSGKYPEAIQKATEANSISPSEESYYLLGNSLYKKKDFASARSAYQKGLDLNPSSEQLLAALALTFTMLGEEEKSLALYTKLTEYFPQNEMYFFKRGISLKYLQSYKDSLASFQKINSNHFSLKSQLFLHLADVYFELQNYTLAIEFYQKAKDVDASLSEADNGKLKARFAIEMENGIKSFSEKKYKSAIQFFLRAIELDSRNSISYFYLGKSYFQCNQYSHAEESLQKSLVLEINNSKVYLQLSAIYHKEEKFQKEIQILEEAIKKFPNEIEFYIQLAKAYKLSGKIKLAVITLIDAKELKKDNLEVRNILSDLFLEEGLVYEALQELKELQALSLNEITLVQKIEMLNSFLKSKKSNEILKKWVDKRKMAKGREYEEKKEWAKAEKYYKDILIKKPEDEFALYRLSIISRQKKEDEKTYDGDEKGDGYFASRKINLALEEYLKSFSSKEKSSTLIKICNMYIELDKKESCLKYIQRVWANIKEYNTDLPETIALLFLKLNQEKTAINKFKEIIEMNPESYQSYYQLGILELERDRRTSLVNFEKAIALNPKYPPALIARGITYYKLGNRERARDDFHYALSKESNLEIASYNLGMILYNDNLYKDAETIFLELTQKYPNFSDPYYHLGYMYFEQKKLSLAEKYILISLELDRNPTTIYAYIKILEEIKKINSKKENINEKLILLKKEIVEKYPDTNYAKKFSESVLGSVQNNLVIQSYPLTDAIVSPPIFINQTILVNYGTSISRLDSVSKSLIWKLETPVPYKILKANSRLYGLAENHIDQLDLESGKKIWTITTKKKIDNFYISDSLLYSEIEEGQEIIYSFSIEGEIQSKLILQNGSKWMLAASGILYIFHISVDGMSWEIYDSRLNLLKSTQTLIGLENGDISFIGSLENSAYLFKGNYVYKFEANGNFAKSQKLENPNALIYLFNNRLYIRTDNDHYSLNDKLIREKKQSARSKNLEIKIDENTYLTSEGILKIKDKTGKLLWSENLKSRSAKNKTGVYSIYTNIQK